MGSTVLSVYVLMWPVIVAVVLAIISRGFLRDWRRARREGRDLV